MVIELMNVHDQTILITCHSTWGNYHYYSSTNYDFSDRSRRHHLQRFLWIACQFLNFLKYNWLIGLQWKQCQTYVWYIKWSKKISKNLVLIVNWVWSLNSEMTKSLKSSPLPWYYSLVSIWSFHSPEIKMRKKIFHETPFQHSFSIGSYTVAPFFKSDFGNCCCCHLPFPVPLWNKQACHLLLLLTMTMAVRILTMITIIHWINWKVAPKLVNNSSTN